MKTEAHYHPSVEQGHELIIKVDLGHQFDNCSYCFTSGKV